MPNKKTVVPYTGTPEQEAKLQEVIQKYKGVPGGTMPVMRRPRRFSDICREGGFRSKSPKEWKSLWRRSMAFPPSIRSMT